MNNNVTWSGQTEVPELKSLEFDVVSGHRDFHRGDANVDGLRNSSDAIYILGYLFAGDPAELECEKSSDIDDGGSIDLTDAINLLTQLFLGGLTPLPPHPHCGQDPTPDNLECASFRTCEESG